MSFVHKPFKDGSTIVTTDEDCFQNICLPSRESNVMQDVKLAGVEVDWFVRFVNIRERVQLGLKSGEALRTSPARSSKQTKESSRQA